MQNDLNVDELRDTKEIMREVVKTLRQIRDEQREQIEREKTRPDLGRIFIDSVRKFIGDYDARTRK